MTRTLPGADIRGYYAALGIELAGWAAAEAPVRCFADPDAHRRGDRHPSASVNLEHGAWHCHGCGAKGGAFDAATARGYPPREAIDLMADYGLTEHRADRRSKDRPRLQRRSISRRPPQPRRTPPPAVRGNIIRWQRALAADVDLIARLARDRGWLYATMLELQLGVDRGRITIPVCDAQRQLIGLLRYQPWPKVGEPKMLAAVGSRRALLPHPATETATHVLLVEGEPDMIAARSRGLPAIAVPGVDAWRNEWAQMFAGRRITIIMDADLEGRLVAKRIARDLCQQAEVSIVDLAPDRADGHDLTGWLLERSALGLDALRAELSSLRLRTPARDPNGNHRVKR